MFFQRGEIKFQLWIKLGKNIDFERLHFVEKQVSTSIFLLLR